MALSPGRARAGGSMPGSAAHPAGPRCGVLLMALSHSANCSQTPAGSPPKKTIGPKSMAGVSFWGSRGMQHGPVPLRHAWTQRCLSPEGLGPGTSCWELGPSQPKTWGCWASYSWAITSHWRLCCSASVVPRGRGQLKQIRDHCWEPLQW